MIIYVSGVNICVPYLFIFYIFSSLMPLICNNNVLGLFNLILSIIILISGIIVLLYEFNEIHTTSCGATLVEMIIINTILTIPSIVLNWWILYKKDEPIDPRIRRNIKYLIQFARLAIIIWDIIFFTMFINYIYSYDKIATSTCQKQAPVSSKYAFYVVIFVGAELIFVTLWCQMIFFLILAILSLHFCCGIPIEVGPNGPNGQNGNNTNEAGTTYLSRTQLIAAGNLIGLGLGSVKEDGEENDMICSICLSEYESTDILRKMPCDHYFHKECIDEWIKSYDKCPICNQKMATAESKFVKDDNTLPNAANTNNNTSMASTNSATAIIKTI